MCHQHTNLRVKIPPLFLKLSHMNSEQVGDYHQILAASPARLCLAGPSPHPTRGGGPMGSGRDLLLCQSPWEQLPGFPVHSWSLEWSYNNFPPDTATPETICLPACEMNPLSRGLETRPPDSPSHLASEPSGWWDTFTVTFTEWFSQAPV